MRFLTCISRLSIALNGVKSEFLAFAIFQAMLSFLEYEALIVKPSTTRVGSTTFSSDSSTETDDEGLNTDEVEDDMFAEPAPSEVSGIPN